MRYFEDFRVGEVMETASATISEEEIITFARQFDPQPFHIDPEAARESFYGGLIASGWHTAAIAMRLMVDGFISEYAGMGSPGLDKLRWLKPVRPGDTLKVRSTCIGKKRSDKRPDMGSCRFETEVINQNGEAVLSMINIGLIRCRAGLERNG